MKWVYVVLQTWAILMFVASVITDLIALSMVNDHLMDLAKINGRPTIFQDDDINFLEKLFYFYRSDLLYFLIFWLSISATCAAIKANIDKVISRDEINGLTLREKLRRLWLYRRPSFLSLSLLTIIMIGAMIGLKVMYLVPCYEAYNEMLHNINSVIYVRPFIGIEILNHILILVTVLNSLMYVCGIMGLIMRLWLEKPVQLMVEYEL